MEKAIAQLTDYERYFDFKENREFALLKYGIQVNQPKLILIVGNYENIDKEQIEEACRRFNRKSEDFEIIDYDTILQLYLQSTCNPESN